MCNNNDLNYNVLPITWQMTWLV